jgi:GNAT superfamily N-acetyltransferase
MIRPLERGDYEQWLILWRANGLNQISDEVTAETWRRLINKKENVFGLMALDEDGNLQGILHYILHPTTGFIEPSCYMQDLFVAKDARRQGIARRLVWELHDIGKKAKWSRIYWFADKNDIAVQNLYKNLGIPMDFTLFMLPTNN